MVEVGLAAALGVKEPTQQQPSLALVVDILRQPAPPGAAHRVVLALVTDLEGQLALLLRMEASPRVPLSTMVLTRLEVPTSEAGSVRPSF